MPQAVAAASAVATWYGTQAALTQALIQLAASAAFTAAAVAFEDRPSAVSTKQELARPNSLPPVRHAYGRYRLYGSPAYRVKGDFLYACMILNSRPSSGGGIAISMDKRPLDLIGDIYDFGGEGATATNDLFPNAVNIWIGLGDQTQPPQMILDEAPDLFFATDAWRGRTVGWFRLDCGGGQRRAKRWPRTPPEIEVEMDWSKVWDPRDPDQDVDDPDTWTWSNNQDLCTLDALMRNPIAQYRLDNIVLQTWIDAANIADEPVPLKAGGTEPRYRLAGVIDWSAVEIEQAIEPMILAGAGGVTRIGGRLAAIPGAYVEPEITITDVLDDDEMVVETLQPGDDMFSGVKATYVDPGRDWRSADAGVYRVPGAADADGGVERIKPVDLGMVTSATQGQRVAKILAMQGRRQRQISGTQPPAAFQAVAGGAVTLAYPAPYAALNGAYKVESINPGINPVGEAGGVALRCPAVLRATGSEDFAWTAATDEQDVFETVQFDGTRNDLAMPGVLTVVSGPDAALGEETFSSPRILVTFEPAGSRRVTAYEVQYGFTGGSWQDGGTIDAEIRDDDDQVYGYIYPVQVGASYDVRVRSTAPGDVSDWRTDFGTVASGPDIALPVPTGGHAVGIPVTGGGIEVTFRTPSSDDVLGVQIFVSAANNSSTATLLVSLSAGPLTTVSYDHTLSPGLTRYYWAKTRGPYGILSGFSAVASGNST